MSGRTRSAPRGASDSVRVVARERAKRLVISSRRSARCRLGRKHELSPCFFALARDRASTSRSAASSARGTRHVVAVPQDREDIPPARRAPQVVERGRGTRCVAMHDRVALERLRRSRPRARACTAHHVPASRRGSSVFAALSRRGVHRPPVPVVGYPFLVDRVAEAIDRLPRSESRPLRRGRAAFS